jgi:uncharacterized protein YkwD
VRNQAILLITAGLVAGQSVLGVSAASATSPAGLGSQSHASAMTGSSLAVTISGAPKARVKVKGSGYRQVVRTSTVMSLPTGTVRVRAFKVSSSGTKYVPKKRKYTLRAKGGKSLNLKVRYRPVAKVITIDTNQPSRKTAIAPSPVPAGEIGVMFDLVNQARSQRQQCGAKSMPPVKPVTYNADIALAAQGHAQDMADKNYFEHDSLDGRSFADRIQATGYRGYPGGENIASGFPTAQDTLNGWLKSPGHCVNLMDGDFDHMGLGFAARKDPRYSTTITYWVQDFGYGS